MSSPHVDIFGEEFRKKPLLFPSLLLMSNHMTQNYDAQKTLNLPQW